jgi:glycolate oxidase FAD binding subunit
MIEPEHLEILSSAVDATGLVEHEPVDVDGVAPSVTLLPNDTNSLQRVLVALGRCGLSVLLRGGGTRLGVGNPPTGGDAFLSMDRLAGIAELDTSDGVCRLGAGTNLADARNEIRESGWELPLEPPGDRATLGGCLAAGAHGPRAQGYGRPKDALLGLDVCLASGESTRCGGRVVKNVTGYDLNKLYTGSHGALGVIESAWLRLKPRPDRIESHARSFDDREQACRIAIEASRRGTARVASLSWVPGQATSPVGQPFRVVVEWAGDDPSVDLDAAWFDDVAGSGAGVPDLVDEVSELQSTLPGRDGLRFRIGVLPTRLASTIAALRDAGASLLTYPGLCQLYAGFLLPEEGGARAVDDVFREVDRVARAAGGEFVCEQAPTWAKSGREMFGASAALVPIYRNLKRRFDPGSMLNPGRFAGGI